jgi:hypothetical protein
MDHNVFLVPDPTTRTIAVHPDPDGDVVSETFTDARTGITYVIARDPEAAHHLSSELHQAVTSPRMGAMADQLRAARRDQR